MLYIFPKHKHLKLIIFLFFSFAPVLESISEEDTGINSNSKFKDKNSNSISKTKNKAVERIDRGEDNKKNKKKFSNTKFVIEKQKKIKLSEYPRLFKAPPIPKTKKQVSVKYEKHVLSPMYDNLNHKLRLLKAKQIELNTLLQNYVGLGFNSLNLRPEIKYFINSKRSTKYSYVGGLYLEIPIKVALPENVDTYLGGDIFITESLTFSSKVDYFKKNYWYKISEKNKNPIYKSQTLNNFNLSTKIKGNHNDLVNYKIGCGYDYFRTNKALKNSRGFIYEHGANGNIGIDYIFHSNGIKISLDSDVAIIKPKIILSENYVSNLQNKPNADLRTLFKIKPSIKYESERFKVDLGMKVGFHNDKESSKKANFGPAIRGEYKLTKHLSPFLEISSDIDRNSYSTFLNENPFWKPKNDTKILNTHKPLDTGGGLNIYFPHNVTLSSGYFFKIYSNMYFFVSQDDNFDIKYDEAQVHNPFIEFMYKTKSEEFTTNFKVDLFLYTKLKKLKEPEHKPKYKLNWLNTFKLYDKLFINCTTHWLGGIRSQSENLKNLVDLDLGINYLLTKRIVASIDLENLLFMKNARYEGIPGAGFNAKISLGFRW